MKIMTAIYSLVACVFVPFGIAIVLAIPDWRAIWRGLANGCRRLVCRVLGNRKVDSNWPQSFWWHLRAM